MFPPQMWIEDVFKVIADKIGEYQEEYMSFIVTRIRRVAIILAKLDPREGLFEKLKFSFDGNSHIQRLDYEEVPFQC